MSKENYKEVDYENYCPKCKHETDSQACDECNECLNTPARLYSRKPECFEEKQ